MSPTLVFMMKIILTYIQTLIHFPYVYILYISFSSPCHALCLIQLLLISFFYHFSQNISLIYPRKYEPPPFFFLNKNIRTSIFFFFFERIRTSNQFGGFLVILMSYFTPYLFRFLIQDYKSILFSHGHYLLSKGYFLKQV